MASIKATAKRPIDAKREQESYLKDYFRKLSDEFNANEYDDVYAFRKKELHPKILRVLREENYSDEKIALILLGLVLKIEKITVNYERMKLNAQKANSTFEKIQEIESSTKKGGRLPLKEYHAWRVWEDYKNDNEGKNPSVNILFTRVNSRLENIRFTLNERKEISKSSLTKQERSLLRQLNDDAEKSSDGDYLYSKRTASAHHKKFLSI